MAAVSAAARLARVGDSPLLRAAAELWSGGGGIRTRDGRKPPITVFETAAFNHSATPPGGGQILATVRRCAGLGRCDPKPVTLGRATTVFQCRPGSPPPRGGWRSGRRFVRGGVVSG